MNTKISKILLLVTLFSLSLGACAGKSALEGTAWQLVDFAGQPVVANTQPTISFQDGQLGGNSSCNTYGGEYKAKGDKIEFGMMMSTMMACADNAAMDQESAFIAFLGNVNRWELRNGQLFLFNADGDALVFDVQGN